MCTEDIIQSEIDKFLEKKEISVPKKKNDFIDYRSEDSTQGVPPIYVSDFQLLKSMQ